MDAATNALSDQYRLPGGVRGRGLLGAAPLSSAPHCQHRPGQQLSAWITIAGDRGHSQSSHDHVGLCGLAACGGDRAARPIGFRSRLLKDLTERALSGGEKHHLGLRQPQVSHLPSVRLCKL